MTSSSARFFFVVIFFLYLEYMFFICEQKEKDARKKNGNQPCMSSITIICRVETVKNTQKTTNQTRNKSCLEMLTSPYDIVLQRTAQHQYFGIYVCEDVPTGVYVATIEPDSPAAKANIQPGDRVIGINGQSVLSLNMNPQQAVIRIAHQSDTITLSIAPSDILKFLGLSSSVDTNSELFSSKTNAIPQDLEQ